MRSLISLLCLGVALCSPALLANTQSFTIQHWKTQSGTPVYFMATPNRHFFDIRWVFHAGSAYDQQHFGLSQATSQLLEEGSKKLSATDIAQQLDNIGAQYHTSVSRDRATVSLRSLTRYAQPAIALFNQIVSQPRFKSKALKFVVSQQQAALKAEQQNPKAIAREALYQHLYPNQPYGHNPLGTLASTASITVKNIKQFYQRYYVAHNGALVIVGDLSQKQARQFSQQLSQGLPQGHPAQPTPMSQTTVTKATLVKLPYPSSQSTLFIGQLGVSRDYPHYMALKLANYIFGSGRENSILYQQIRRKRGLAYYVYSYFNPLLARGPFIITLQTATKKVPETLALIKSQLNHFLNHGPTAQQLTAAKEAMIGALPVELSTNAALTRVLSAIAFYQLPLNFLRNYGHQVQVITRKQILAALRSVISPKQLTTIAVGQSAPPQKKKTA